MPARCFFLLACGFFLFTPVLAQEQGSIVGVVVDAENGETLPGANVVVEGTSIGTTTDLDGRYELEVAPGTYNIVFSYIGYNSATVQNAEVAADEPTRLEMQLTSEAVGMDEVVVEAVAIRNNEAALLKDRQKSNAVSDAISAESISRSGSSDAADAMEKVTGASVVGGKYVYVRGLGERYSNTQLNGVELPSADPDRKAVQFDLFPSNLLDNIVTIKTFTPDKPGNFSGGLVDIGTKSFPERFSFQFSASASMNTQSSFADDFLTYPGGGTDWLATDDGTRSIPDALGGGGLQIPSEAQARFNPEMAAELDRFSKSFNNVLAPTTQTGPVNQSYSVSLGNQSRVFGNSLGYVISGTYSNAASFYDDGFTGRYAFAGAGAETLGPDLLLNDTRGTQETSIGGLANFTYRLGSNNEVGLHTLYTRSGESESRLQVGQWEELDISDPNSLFISRTLGYTERELYSLQLRGRHFLPGLLRAEIEWSGALSETKQNEPDRRFVASTERIVGGQTVRTITGSNFRDPSRYYRDLNEDNYNFNLDVSVPFKQWGGLGSQFKLGGAYQQASRTFHDRAIEISPNPNLDYGGDPDAFFSNENMGIIGVDTLGSGENTSLRYTFGNVIRDASKPKNNYVGDREIVAGYAMMELPLLSRLRLIGGARVETTLLEVESEDPTAGSGSIDEVDVLPSVNLVYQVLENMNLRAAVTRTLARPTFREIAPFESFAFNLASIELGNPDLERTLITNYDTRWEWFTRPGELVAVSLFYKQLTNPIERAIVGGTNGQLQYQNVDAAEVYGVEFEVRSRLDRVLSPLQDFSVGLNLSLVQSKIDIPGVYDDSGTLVAGELFRRRQVDPQASSTRNLQGQSPYTLNADLSYANFESGTTAGLYFSAFGDRLANVSLGGTPDVYERSSPQLDFTLSQEVFSGWSVKFSAKNLLDSSFEETYRFTSSLLSSAVEVEWPPDPEPVQQGLQGLRRVLLRPRLPVAHQQHV
ncbi:MAG: TonB-dependent receptor domain-containing protein, partial [Rhodothermales bacterium]